MKHSRPVGLASETKSRKEVFSDLLTKNLVLGKLSLNWVLTGKHAMPKFVERSANGFAGQQDETGARTSEQWPGGWGPGASTTESWRRSL